jgi:putative permease
VIEVVQKWYRRYFSEEESIVLLALLLFALFALLLVGDILAPFLVAVVLAYLMQGVANQVKAYGLSEQTGFWVASLLFLGGFVAFTFALVPLVWRQMMSFAKEAPQMVDQGREALAILPARYPQLFSEAQLNQILSMVQTELTAFGQTFVTRSISTIPDLLALLVYVILIPIMVFFLLKDRDKIVHWGLAFLPQERPLLNDIWGEMNQQFANYARGKVIEILIVGGVSYLTFVILGLDYAALLALVVGLSVIIPYIGATLVTVPVVMVAFFQWGVGPDFYYVALAYLVIQVLDGNVLVPLLFSEAVNLHPIAIIVAVLFFGGIWGLWGVFFAIPLATLVNAIINAWPTRPDALETL